MVVNRLPVTKGVKAMLLEATGKPIFVGRLPKDQDAIPAPPYGIVYMLDGGSLDGPPFWDPDADATFVYQVTSVGLDATGAEWMADKVRQGFLGRAVPADEPNELPRHLFDLPVGDGQKIMARRSRAGAGGTDVSEGMVTIAEQFQVSVTPA